MSRGFEISRNCLFRRRKSKPQAEKKEMALLEKLNFV
jgi:hypothetical protein